MEKILELGESAEYGVRQRKPASVHQEIVVELHDTLDTSAGAVRRRVRDEGTQEEVRLPSVTRTGMRGAAISAVAALVVCLAATRVSADPASTPVDSATAAPEVAPSEPPPPSPSGGTIPGPHEPENSAETSPKSPPPAEVPSEPDRASEGEAKAPDPERKRRREILDDQFEELTEDAPIAGGGSTPAPEEQPRPPTQKPDPPSGAESKSLDGDDSDPSALEDSPTQVLEEPAAGASEAPSPGESDLPSPEDSKRSTQHGDERAVTQSRAAAETSKTFEELSEDAPRAKADSLEEPTVAPELEPSEDDASAAGEAQADSAGEQPEVSEKRRIEFSWNRGLRIDGRDQHFRLKVGGRLFIDVASISGDTAIESNFETGGFIGARQARIDVTGTWGSRLYYRLQVDLTGKSSTGRSRNEYLKSFFVGYVGPRWLGRAELGVIKEPFSMDVLTSGLNLDFLERGLPTVFAPSFNPGIVFRNEAFDDRMFWAFGVFRFVGSGRENDRVDITGRIGGVPWTSEDGANFVHVAASYAALFGSEFGLEVGSRPETSFGDKWVEASGLNVDNGHLFGMELAGALNGFSYQSEIILAKSQRLELPDLTTWGAYAQVSYFLTGEERRYLKRQGVFGRVAINQTFDWKKRRWGAWEVTARYSYLDLDDAEVRGGIMNNFTLGLNWYIAPNFRTMANYVHSHVNGLGTGHVFSLRFQIDL